MDMDMDIIKYNLRVRPCLIPINHHNKTNHHPGRSSNSFEAWPGRLAITIRQTLYMYEACSMQHQQLH